MTDTSILFQPTAIGPLQLKNRLAVAPMTRVSASEDGRATPEMAAYYGTFAAGGFAAIITEATYVDERHSQGYLYQPGLANDAQRDAWKPVVEAIHAGGALAIMQFVHAGALNQGRNAAYPEGAIAPSAVKPKGTKLTFYRGEGEYDVPREITVDEMIEVKDAFAAASVRALEAGFDAIEMHGANGYLLDQFWTAYTNQRTDEYGGSARNRIRFDEEIIKAAIAATQGRIPIGLRLSQSKVNDFEYQWAGGEQDAADIFPVLDEAGMAFIHITEHDATAEVFGSGKTLAGLAHTYSKAPVIVNGGLGDPAKAAGVVERGEADIIAQGKAALANPDWPAKVQAGDELAEFDFGMFNPLADLASQAAWPRAPSRTTHEGPETRGAPGPCRPRASRAPGAARRAADRFRPESRTRRRPMCTSFTLRSTRGDVVYGRTLEFTLPLRSVPIVFPAGISLTGTGLAGEPGVGGLTWETTHAAVGMNAIGLDIIIDGVNDAGLVAAAFNFPVSAEYIAITPEQEARAVASHEIGTYLLTTCATIAEVRAALAAVPVHGPRMAAYGGQVPMVHYSIHDAEGNSIAVEWTNGELAIHDNPTTVLTNEPPFPMQIAHLAEYAYLSPEPPMPIELPGLTLRAPSSGGGMQAIPGGFLASNRFVRAFWAARCVPAFDTPEEGIQFARHILNGFDIPPGSVITPAGEGESGGQAGWEMTEWSCMADCTNRAFYVNQFAHQGWARIDLGRAAKGLTAPTCLTLPERDRFHELPA